MSDDETALTGTVVFPPRFGSLETKFGPLTLRQAAWIMGSGTTGAVTTYGLLEVLPKGASLVAYALFFVVFAAGLIVGLAKRDGLPFVQWLLLRQRFNSMPHKLTGPDATKFVHLTDVAHDTLVLPNDTYARVLEVQGVNFPLLSPSEQAQHLGSFLHVLNSLDFDVQIITRPDKFDSGPYLRALTRCGESEANPVTQSQIIGYVPFFDKLTEATLDRKFYVVVTARLRHDAPHLFTGGKVPTAAEREESARAILDQRTSAVGDHLTAGGLDSAPLEGKEMVSLLRSYYQFGLSAPAKRATSLREALAPAKVELLPETLVVGSERVRVLQVERYPASLPYGWLLPFLTAQARVDVVLHLHSVSQDLSRGLLNNEITRLQVELLGKREKGTTDVSALEHQVAAFEELRASLVRGDERLFLTGLYLGIRAETDEALDALAGKVQSTLRGLLVSAKTPLFRPLEAYRTLMPFGRDFLGDDYPLPTSSLATTFPFVSAVLAQETGILYGVNEINGTPVIFDRFSLENYNTCIFGTSGSGKSYLAKLEILRYRMLDPDLRVFIIDPLREFTDTTYALDGTALRIGRDGDTHVNPLWVGPDNAERARHALEFLDVLLQWTSDEKEERALLDGVLSKMYRARGEEFTLQDLMDELERETSLQAEHLRLVLQPHVSGSSSFLNHETDVDLSSAVVAFDIRDLDPDLFPPVMTLVLSFLSCECARNKDRKIIVVDEAWHLMDRPASANALANLTRRSRHDHAGLTLISQTAADFLDHEKGRVVLANAAMVTLVRHRAVTEGMREHWSLTPAEVNVVRYAKTGKDSGYSTGLLLTGTMRTPLRILSSPGEHELITTNPEDLQEREEDSTAEPELASAGSIVSTRRLP